MQRVSPERSKGIPGYCLPLKVGPRLLRALYTRVLYRSQTEYFTVAKRSTYHRSARTGAPNEGSRLRHVHTAHAHHTPTCGHDRIWIPNKHININHPACVTASEVSVNSVTKTSRPAMKTKHSTFGTIALIARLGRLLCVHCGCGSAADTTLDSWAAGRDTVVLSS